jgi:hypothetical protein
MKRKLLLLLACTLAIVAIELLASGTTYYCGGNVAAGANVGFITEIARFAAFQDPDRTFRFREADAELREDLANYSHNHWVPEARFLVTDTPILFREPVPRVIVVCDTPFRGPERWFGTPPPRHAACFSDGTFALISIAEFAALDHSTFIPVDDLGDFSE